MEMAHDHQIDGVTNAVTFKIGCNCRQFSQMFSKDGAIGAFFDSLAGGDAVEIPLEIVGANTWNWDSESDLYCWGEVSRKQDTVFGSTFMMRGKAIESDRNQLGTCIKSGEDKARHGFARFDWAEAKSLGLEKEIHTAVSKPGGEQLERHTTRTMGSRNQPKAEH